MSKEYQGISQQNTKLDIHRMEECWCLLIRDRRWSAKQKRQLIRHFSCPSKVLSASYAQTSEVIQRKQSQANANIDVQQIKADLQWLSSPQNHLITINDTRYPEALLQLPDPPLALFASGKLSLLNEPVVAIVGSRRPTPIGAKITHDLSAGLAKLGIVIASGMALGVDGLAHQAALEVGGGTIAVMGCGLDIVYPLRNTGLRNDIAVNGLLISEFALGVKPTKYTFPMRNRIVSGLAHGVIIVEAAKRSGTLITAGFASEQNKEVMVVPGSALSSQYAGSHDLIMNGAALVTSTKDVLRCLAVPLRHVLLETKNEEGRQSGKSLKHPLLEFIGAESTSMDAIIFSSGLTTAEVSSILLELELDGLVAATQEGGYMNLS